MDVEYEFQKISNIGPIDSITIRCFVNHECEKCKAKIRDHYPLFGNAWCINENKISLLCRKCRSPNDWQKNFLNSEHKTYLDGAKLVKPSQDFDSFSKEDLQFLMICLNKHRAELDMSWHEILIAFRNSKGNLQGCMSNDEYLKRKFRDTKEVAKGFKGRIRYGDYHSIDSIYTAEFVNSCFECGNNPSWNPNMKVTPTNYPNDCYNCKIPNELQWHKREKFETEMKNIIMLAEMQKYPHLTSINIENRFPTYDAKIIDDKKIIKCKKCNLHIRVDKNKEGIITCPNPNCNNKFYERT